MKKKNHEKSLIAEKYQYIRAYTIHFNDLRRLIKPKSFNIHATRESIVYSGTLHLYHGHSSKKPNLIAFVFYPYFQAYHIRIEENRSMISPQYLCKQLSALDHPLPAPLISSLCEKRIFILKSACQIRKNYLNALN